MQNVAKSQQDAWLKSHSHLTSSKLTVYPSPRATDWVLTRVNVFPSYPLTLSPHEHLLPEYIGHDLYDPIWHELNKRHAVVLLHGAQTPSSTPYPHPFLGVPITEARSIQIYSSTFRS